MLFKASFRKKIGSIVESFPGYKLVGPYAFLPVFFSMGAALEFVMIKWEPNGHNFYKTFMHRQAEERAAAIFEQYRQSRDNQEKS